jgi:hypothetical protein
MNAPAAPGTYKTMFQNTDQQGTSTDENVSFENLGYEPVIPFTEGTTTGIQPTLITIEADGTCRYFDLQGRMLNGKPDKGLYIENGKKVIYR